MKIVFKGNNKTRAKFTKQIFEFIYLANICSSKNHLLADRCFSGKLFPICVSVNILPRQIFIFLRAFILIGWVGVERPDLRVNTGNKRWKIYYSTLRGYLFALKIEKRKKKQK